MYADMLNQTATWWARIGQDGYGKPLFSAPVSLPCRWEEGRTLDRGEGYEMEVRSARVFLSSSVSVGDYLYSGESTEADPLGVDGAGEIKGAPRIPSIDADVTLYMALVMRGV